VTVMVRDDMPNRGFAGLAGGEERDSSRLIPEWEGSFPTKKEKARSVRESGEHMTTAGRIHGQPGPTVPQSALLLMSKFLIIIKQY
jgi:hypothetical protein